MWVLLPLQLMLLGGPWQAPAPAQQLLLPLLLLLVLRGAQQEHAA